MNKKIAFAVFSALLFFIGCPNIRNLKQVSDISTVNCAELQYEESGVMVFRDQKSWENFWQQYCQTVNAEGVKLTAPKVDFSTKMLIGVFAGAKPTGGYSISIQRIMESSKSILVEYKETEPSPDAMVTMAFTYPCHIVSVTRSEKNVEFKAVKK